MYRKHDSMWYGVHNNIIYKCLQDFDYHYSPASYQLFESFLFNPL